MAEAKLKCLSPKAAQTVAKDADLSAQNQRAKADRSTVVLTYTDERYPLEVAD